MQNIVCNLFVFLVQKDKSFDFMPTPSPPHLHIYSVTKYYKGKQQSVNDNNKNMYNFMSIFNIPEIELFK